MKSVSAFSTTILYNGENVSIKLLNSDIPTSTVQSISNEPGVSTVILTNDLQQDIKK